MLGNSLAAALLCLVGSKAQAQTPTMPASPQPQETAQGNTANSTLKNNWLRVDFTEGSTFLTEAQKTALRDFVKGQGGTFPTQTIYVAGFADQNVENSGRRATLGKGAVLLANNRIDTVHKELEKLGLKGKILDVNMARQPNVMRALMGREVDRSPGRTKTGAKGEHPANVADASQVIDEHGGLGRVIVYLGQ